MGENGLELSLGLDDSELLTRLNEAKGATEDTAKAMAASLEQINQKLLIVASASEAAMNGVKAVGEVKLAKVDTEIQALQKSLQSVGDTAKDVMAVFGAITAASGGLTKEFLDAASNTAKYEITLKALTGSAEAAAQKMESFSAIANKFGFPVDDIRRAGTTLAQFGLDTDKFLPKAAAMASAFGKTVPEATQTLVRAFEGGSRGLRQLELQYGITEAKIISFGATVNTVTGKINTEGAGNMEAFKNAVLQAIEPLDGALLEKSESFAASTERLKNNLQDLFSQIGKTIAPTATKVVDAITNAIAWFEKLPPSLKTIVGEGVALTAIVGTIVTGIAGLTIAFAATLNAGTRVASAFGFIAAEANAATGAVNRLTAAQIANKAAGAAGNAVGAAGSVGGAATGAAATSGGLGASLSSMASSAGTAIAAINPLIAGLLALAGGLTIATIAQTASNETIDAATNAAVEHTQALHNESQALEKQLGGNKQLGDQTAESLEKAGVTARMAAGGVEIFKQKLLENTQAMQAARDELDKIRQEKADPYRSQYDSQGNDTTKVLVDREKAAYEALATARHNVAKLGSSQSEYQTVAHGDPTAKFIADSKKIEDAKADFDEKMKEGDSSVETKQQQSAILDGFVKQYDALLKAYPEYADKIRKEKLKLDAEVKKTDNAASKENFALAEKDLAEKVKLNEISEKQEIAGLENLQQLRKNLGQENTKEYKATSEKIAEIRKKDHDEEIKDALDMANSLKAANAARENSVRYDVSKKGADPVEAAKTLNKLAEENFNIETNILEVNYRQAILKAAGDETKLAILKRKYDADTAKLSDENEAKKNSNDDFAAGAQAKAIQNETKLVEARKEITESELGNLEKRLELNQAVGPQIMEHIKLLQQENEQILKGNLTAALKTEDDPKAKAALIAKYNADLVTSQTKTSQDLIDKQNEIDKVKETGIQKDIELNRKVNDEKLASLQRLADAGIDVSSKEITALKEKEQIIIQEIQARAELEKIGKGPVDQARLQKEAEIDIKTAVKAVQDEIDTLNAKYKDGTKSLKDQIDAQKQLNDEIKALQKKIDDKESADEAGPQSAIPESDADKLEKLKIKKMRSDGDVQAGVNASNAQAQSVIDQPKQIQKIKDALAAGGMSPEDIAKTIANNFPGYTDPSVTTTGNSDSATGTPNAVAPTAAPGGVTPAASAAKAGGIPGLTPATGSGGGVGEGPVLRGIAADVKSILSAALKMSSGDSQAKSSSSGKSASVKSSDTLKSGPQGDQRHNSADQSSMYPGEQTDGLYYDRSVGNNDPSAA